eukprot:g1702.t1
MKKTRSALATILFWAAAFGADASQEVKVGASVFVESQYAALAGAKRVAVMANPSSLLPDLSYQHIVDRMNADKARSNIAMVFGPEHGFRGDQQAGSGGPKKYTDPQTGLPVWSTYGVHGNDLVTLVRTSGADAFVFDIQDIGVRYYTFIWSMYELMVACARVKNNSRFVVLDRPNPIGGEMVKGPVLDPNFSSFVGRLPIAQIHGMTVAELARLFNHKFVAKDAGDGRRVELVTVAMEGWKRSNGWPFHFWVPPSPNIPTHQTAVMYSGGFGIIEGTSVSEGRGTTTPFETIGAAYLDYNFSIALAAQFPGILREAFFIPTFSKFTGQVCAGVSVASLPASFDVQRAALEVIIAAARYKGFSWTPTFDLLLGNNYTRCMIDAGASVDEVLTRFKEDLQSSGFLQDRERFLLYQT